MRNFIVVFAAASALASTAGAADKPLIGPPPAWVRPVALPKTEPKSDESAIRVLLSDQQIAFEAGRQTVYSDLAFRIQSPQGLAAGNVSIPWRPDTDVLTVHKLLIHRGDQVIDVLASGQTFTVVRRETKLESATLDGVLTANIQPEGLQVGDVLEFAASVNSSDPTLKGHVEQAAGAWNGIPIERTHLRMQWPSSLPLRFRQTGDLPVLQPVTADGAVSVEISLDGVKPMVLPKGAPGRFQTGRMIELSDFTTWADLAALMAPLYQKAAVLPAQGPLQAEVARIKALSPDPKLRAEAALALVQDRVRYVALAMGAGGLVPVDAETTWSQRYGDCKGKTALLLALLQALDIQAEPVLVSSTFGDGLDSRLPMIGLFDHVLVRAIVAGRTYWLDGTRTGDTRLDRIQTPPFGWGLPAVPKGAALVRMVPAPLDGPTSTLTIRIDATAGLAIPAPTKIEAVLKGDAATIVNLSLKNLVGDARDRALRDYWRQQYDFIDIQSTDAAFDVATGEQRLSMEGLARMEWRDGWFETNDTAVGYRADFSRDPGPDQDAPFTVIFPYFNKTMETILLPPSFRGQKADPKAEVDRTVAGIEYRRHANLVDGVFTIEKTERSIAPEFPFKEAAAAQGALRDLAGQAVFIRRPADYRPTDQEVAATLASTPTTAAAFRERGFLFITRSQYDEGIKDLDQAIALDTTNSRAFTARAFARVAKGQPDLAEKDLDAAAALDPRNAAVFSTRALILRGKRAFADAVAAYTTALEIQPNDTFLLSNRAKDYMAAGNDEAALVDATAVLKLDPKVMEMQAVRAIILLRQGKEDEARSEASAMVAANPDAAYAHQVAGGLYYDLKMNAESAREYDRAIAIKPDGQLFIERGLRRPQTDLKGRLADANAAIRLNPKLTRAYAFKARTQVQMGDFRDAVVSYSAALELEGNRVEILSYRGVAYILAGDNANAEKDFAAVRAASTSAARFNMICWAKATAGVALQSALTDCADALRETPNSAGFLDSQGLVLLRLGRFDEAIAAYDRALAANPAQGASLFGRAVAWARKGDKARSDADLAAAIKTDPNVRTEFERYGVKL